MKTHREKSAHVPLMAAGGVVIKAGRVPLIAVVRRRKDDGWVLPRGKLKPRESALTAARREVEQETGHTVAVQDFLGTISYEACGRLKIIQFWLMTSVANAEHEDSHKTLKWLPLNAAVACLTEPLEKAFLAQIGRQSLRTPRVRLRRDKTRPGHGNSARQLSSQPSRPRANVRTAQSLRAEKSLRAKTPHQNSLGPNFIRRLFRRLKNPRLVSSHSAHSG